MQRNSVVGTRSSLLWLLILVVVVLLIGIVVVALVILPQQQASRAEQALLAEVERHYQAGVAFQGVDDWTSAEGEFKQVVALDAGYKDATERLASVRVKLKESAAEATAVAVAQSEREQVDARATVQAAAAATQQALEVRYQRAVAYLKMERWVEAKRQLELVFESDPNYKDVQEQLRTVEAKIALLVPTSTPTPVAAATPWSSPTVIVCRYEEDINVAEVSASSVWDERYLPEKAIDGDLNTGWWAGHGKGNGEWLDLQLPFEATLVRIDVLNGFPPYWNGNPRLKAVTVVFSDGSTQQLTFYDNVKTLQTKKLMPVQSSHLRIIVDDIYKSDNFEAPGMNEIKVFGCRD